MISYGAQLWSGPLTHGYNYIYSFHTVPYHLAIACFVVWDDQVVSCLHCTANSHPHHCHQIHQWSRIPAPCLCLLQKSLSITKIKPVMPSFSWRRFSDMHYINHLCGRATYLLLRAGDCGASLYDITDHVSEPVVFFFREKRVHKSEPWPLCACGVGG